MTAVVRCLALAASMLISYAVERDLALAHGVPVAVAPAVPIAIDLFVIWAVRVGRDIPLAVSVAVAANVAGVLTTEPLSAVNTWVAAGLHAIFPVSLWRMHRADSATRTRKSLPDMATANDRTEVANGPQADSWPDADLWQDFADSEAGSADAEPVTPPTAEDVRAAMAVLGSRDGRPVTGRMMADHFGVSERTGRRYLAMAT
ncbi:transfer protein spdA [Streptomyces sp. NPDC003401]